MGLILALPGHQKASEHADWAAITDLPQIAIDAELLRHAFNQSTLLARLKRPVCLALVVHQQVIANV